MLAYWQQHKDQLYRYITKHVDQPDVVDDILQDVYLKAHLNLQQLKSIGSISGWLYRIAHNAIMDYYRRHRAFDELPDEIAAEEPDDQLQAHQEVATCLKPLIDQLPELYRVPLQMSEIEGLPQKHVAEHLGISLSGAKSRIQRGRTKLRDSLIECCNIEVGRGGILSYEPKEPDNICGTSRAC